MQSKTDQWCAVFEMEYVFGEPRSDHYENSESLLLNPTKAIDREDITNMSRELLKIYTNHKDAYVPKMTMRCLDRAKKTP